MAKGTKTGVYFFYDGTRFFFKNRSFLKSFVASIFRKEKTGLGLISFVFTNDKTLLDINREYLNHNYLTDIITFPLSEPGMPIIADIYISIDRVNENSRTFKLTQTEELHRVIFHGTLHLCGYSDKTKSQKAEMRLKENFYLSKYFNRRFT